MAESNEVCKEDMEEEEEAEEEEEEEEEEEGGCSAAARVMRSCCHARASFGLISQFATCAHAREEEIDGSQWEFH